MKCSDTTKKRQTYLNLNRNKTINQTIKINRNINKTIQKFSKSLQICKLFYILNHNFKTL